MDPVHIQPDFRLELAGSDCQPGFVTSNESGTTPRGQEKKHELEHLGTQIKHKNTFANCGNVIGYSMCSTTVMHAKHD